MKSSIASNCDSNFVSDKVLILSLPPYIHKTLDTPVIFSALYEPPWYGTVCPVVWEDGGSNPASYPITPRAAAAAQPLPQLAAPPTAGVLVLLISPSRSR